MFLFITTALHGRKPDTHDHNIRKEPIGYCGCWIREYCIVPGCDYVKERRCNKDEMERYLKGGR